MVGYPSLSDFKNMIKNNMILNCDVTLEDIQKAEQVYSPDIYAFKGKTTRVAPIPVSTLEWYSKIGIHYRK